MGHINAFNGINYSPVRITENQLNREIHDPTLMFRFDKDVFLTLLLLTPKFHISKQKLFKALKWISSNLRSNS